MWFVAHTTTTAATATNAAVVWCKVPLSFLNIKVIIWQVLIIKCPIDLFDWLIKTIIGKNEIYFINFEWKKENVLIFDSMDVTWYLI